MPNSIRHRNGVLAALPDAVWAEWQPRLEISHHNGGAVLHEADSTVSYVYFPISCVVSMMQTLTNGATAQIAVIGREGLVGAPAVLGGTMSRTHAIVQFPGLAARLRSDVIVPEFERGGWVMHLLLRHTQAVVSQMAQAAICNRHHSPEQQLCRWLLMALDRLDDLELNTTQELVASMLGVRRETVSDAARKLQAQGIVELRRSRVRVLDRAALERHVCECYAVVAREYARLFSSKIF